jgi:hypothetical protein
MCQGIVEAWQIALTYFFHKSDKNTYNKFTAWFLLTTQYGKGLAHCVGYKK